MDSDTPGWQLSHAQKWEAHGITIGYATSSFLDIGTYRTQNSKDCIRLHFGLIGDYSFQYKQINHSYDLIGGHHNLLYSNGLDLEISNKSEEIKTFGVEIPKKLFLKFGIGQQSMQRQFIEKIKKGDSTIYSDQWGAVTVPIQKIIDEIILNPYQGDLQQTFLLAKTLELLVLCVDQYQRSEAPENNILKNKGDQEKIIAARDFINKRISTLRLCRK